MVISKILSVLKNHGLINFKYPHGSNDEKSPAEVVIVAMHIDYSNRPESGEEAAFVRDWAEEKLGFVFRMRVISEVTRGVTDRYRNICRISFHLYLAAQIRL
jgi:hypothetical protein